jgi:hypothetical protein
MLMPLMFEIWTETNLQPTASYPDNSLGYSVMQPASSAFLLQYDKDGEYINEPFELEAQVVADERHGVVLEILLPANGSQQVESAVQIGIPQLAQLLKTRGISMIRRPARL